MYVVSFWSPPPFQEYLPGTGRADPGLLPGVGGYLFRGRGDPERAGGVAGRSAGPGERGFL